jgi:hypothetical protein
VLWGILRQLRTRLFSLLVSTTTVECSERRWNRSGALVPSPAYVNTYKPPFSLCFIFARKSPRQTKSCGRFTNASNAVTNPGGTSTRTGRCAQARSVPSNRKAVRVERTTFAQGSPRPCAGIREFRTKGFGTPYGGLTGTKITFHRPSSLVLSCAALCFARFVRSPMNRPSGVRVRRCRTVLRVHRVCRPAVRKLGGPKASFCSAM